jgi:peptidoglycan/xylan/chitin deacetylase (PgdA/CDA1 family)
VRRRRRRRRLTALGCGLALIALLVVVIGSTGGSGAAKRSATTGLRAAVLAPPRGGTRDTRSAGGALRVSATLRAALATGNANIQRLAQLGRPIYCAGPRGNAVAFTFDDGPGPYTHLAIRKLMQAGERATFFVVGRSMDNYPGYLPHELKVAAIGDHTYTHPELPALPPSSITSELQRTMQKIEADSGQHVDLFRPPYGLHDATVDQIAKRLGLLEIIWNVDSADSLGANYAQIIKNVEAGMHPGAIILMHENRGQTIRALTTLLPELHRRHLRSVSLPELFASDPPSEAQVRRGTAGCGDPGKSAAGTGG